MQKWLSYYEKELLNVCSCVPVCVCVCGVRQMCVVRTILFDEIHAMELFTCPPLYVGCVTEVKGNYNK